MSPRIVTIEPKVELSIIIPVFNEGESLRSLHQSLCGVLSGLPGRAEILFIDDGSTDQTVAVLRELFQEDERVRVVRLSRNFGQTAALSAGFHHARGRVVVTMDGDLQNAAEDIPILLRKLEEGFDVVSGWRSARQDPWLTRQLPSRFANLLISGLTRIPLHDFGCTLKAYRREVVEHLHLYGEMHRMIPVLAYWTGARLAEVEVSHRPRQHGRSKYSMTRILAVLLDLISVIFFTGYSTRPIHLFGLLGLLSLVIGGLSFAAMVLMKLYSGTDMTGNPFLILFALFTIIGIQLIMLGLLGEISVRSYYEIQDKPTYLVREVLER